jgi:hypothetical protein
MTAGCSWIQEDAIPCPQNQRKGQQQWLTLGRIHYLASLDCINMHNSREKAPVRMIPSRIRDGRGLLNSGKNEAG